MTSRKWVLHGYGLTTRKQFHVLFKDSNENLTSTQLNLVSKNDLGLNCVGFDFVTLWLIIQKN